MQLKEVKEEQVRLAKAQTIDLDPSASANPLKQAKTDPKRSEYGVPLR